MLRAILDLDNMTVEDIMIPRNEVSGLDLEDDIEILMEQILSCEYTRQPIYSGDINNIVAFFMCARLIIFCGLKRY